jgi:four helix bundle protein
VQLKHYQELIAWQKAIALVTEIYSATKSFPRDELYGLISQLRRAAVSVASNIAEGQGRATRGESVQFLGHARGSLCEIETQIVIATNLHYLAPDIRDLLSGRFREKPHQLFLATPLTTGHFFPEHETHEHLRPLRQAEQRPQQEARRLQRQSAADR